MKFDVLIVGAGPAGSTVATLLSQKGINVLLVDAKVYPREKLCAELISKKAYTVINDIFGFDLESSIYSAVSNDVSLYSEKCGTSINK